MRFEKSAGAVIFYRNPEGKNEYLLLNHGNDYWNFPKGHIEKGEPVLDTVKREIKEEVGLENIKIIPGFRICRPYFFRAPENDYIPERRRKFTFKTAIFLLAQTETKDVKISFEHEGYEWLEFENALERLKKYKSIQKILKKADEFLKK